MHRTETYKNVIMQLQKTKKLEQQMYGKQNAKIANLVRIGILFEGFWYDLKKTLLYSVIFHHTLFLLVSLG